MIQLIVTHRLHRRITGEKDRARVISMRPLKKREIEIARRLGIRRFYLPRLTETQEEEFLSEFDAFWNKVVESFGPGHPFWRNAVSSKMQEWECSAAYFALILFVLAQGRRSEPELIIIVCASIQEEDLCVEWGKKMGWKVYRRPAQPIPRWFRQAIQEIVNLKRFMYLSRICLRRKWFSGRYDAKSFRKNRQVLIVSLFYNRCFKNGGYVDHFFGNLHNIIREDGKGVIYLCGPLEEYKEAIRKVLNCKEVSIVIPYSTIGWCKLLREMVKVFVRRIRFDRCSFVGVDFSRLMAWNSRRFTYLFTLESEIYYAAMLNLCKTEDFDELIQLYEGNAFERACIQAFRESGSGRILGYSHAVVFPLNLKIRLTDGEKKGRPEPDFLLSTGDENKRLMVEVGRRESATVRSACSLRHIPMSESSEGEDSRSSVLIALDGVWTSVAVLDWLFENAESLKDHKFRLRSHPDIPMKFLLDQCLSAVPENVMISDGDLKQDIESSLCVIYRQTSVGIQALMNGVPVIHLCVDAPLRCDPMMGLETSKWVAGTIEELLAALEEIHRQGGRNKRAPNHAAKSYARSYFTPPNKTNLKSFFADEPLTP